MLFTPYGVFAVTWTVIPAFEYGWHISALNMIQAALTCRDTGSTDEDPGGVLSSFTPCIPMSDATFSIVTSSYTVGGLLGSLSASYMVNRYGRKGALRTATALFAIGGSIMAGAREVFAFGLGRVICGVGAGVGVCVVPIMLAELAPSKIRGSVGVLNQLGIVFGILSTQALGMNYTEPRAWRKVLSVASIIAVVHVLLSFIMIESPVWLRSRGRKDEATRAAGRLWSAEDDISDPLLDNTDAAAASQEEGLAQSQHAVSVLDVIRTMAYRRPLTIVSLIMVAQQISGINAVLYYSTDILSRIMPASAAWISLMITIVNALMTFPAISLIERLGRRKLLVGSAFGAIASLLLVGLGIDFGITWLASVAILSFVASFAVGVGPVPYVVISDVAPARTIGAMSTIALSLNWVTNFVVALIFLPLRNFLSDGGRAATKEGRVFYVFAFSFFCVFVTFLRLYK